MGKLLLPGQEKPLRQVFDPGDGGPSLAEKLDLEVNDIIEVQDVRDSTIAFHYRLRPRQKCIIVAHDDYFRHLPEVLVGDPKHLIAVSITDAKDTGEPFNLTVLEKHKIGWKKIGKVPGIRWE